MKKSPWLLCTLVVAVFLVAAISETCWAAEDIVIADFKKNPLPAGWQMEGYAFGSRKPGPHRQQAARTTANQQQYQTGKLTSPEFTIERDYLLLEIGGVYHPEKCCVALVVDGRDVRRVSPGEAGNCLASSMDLCDLRGKQDKPYRLGRPWGHRGPTPEEAWQRRKPIAPPKPRSIVLPSAERGGSLLHQ